MAKHYIPSFLIVILLSISGNIFADEYAVHLTTSAKPMQKEYGDYDIYGSLYSVIDNNGKIMTCLGPFSDKAMAEEVLNEIRVAGHADASVIKYDNSNLVVDKNYQSTHTNKQRYESNKVNVEEVLDPESLELWKLLTPEQRTNVIYHKGRLKIRKDDEPSNIMH